MIIAEQKPIQEIKSMIAGYRKVLIVGCGTCVTVCMAGGEKEVGVLASALRMACKLDGKEIETEEVTIERQCEWEFIDQLKERIEEAESVLSMGCGVGVQAISERFSHIPVYPALNTMCLGLPEEQGIWTERCVACGDCILDKTGGICPIARCSKGLLNGPCGGSSDGKCEIDKEIDCGWQLIYDRLRELGRLEELSEIIPPKDWSSARDGGPRKTIRKDVRI
ncbi:MAG: methylenetetrahydrofolate reductase C-terminal domain-containing protein [bacterium]|nr:methylenetetrahydrofolate reductase C-terminal domain-containing protein [bacterium]